MEDDKSTTDPAVDSSNTDDDVDLEDMEVSFDDVEEVEEDGEDSKESTNSNESTDEAEEESEDETEQSDESEESSDDKSEDTESDEDKQSAIKAHNNEMAQRRIQEKQQREARIKKEQDNYVTESETEEQSAIRQLQVDAYNTKVEGLTNKLANGYQKALTDFKILSDPNPKIQAEVDAALDAFQAMHVSIDSYGNPREIRGDLYSYLQTKADSIQGLTGIGASRQVENKSKEKSKTFTPPNRVPKTPKADPDLEGFDEEANRW